MTLRDIRELPETVGIETDVQVDTSDEATIEWTGKLVSKNGKAVNSVCEHKLSLGCNK